MNRQKREEAHRGSSRQEGAPATQHEQQPGPHPREHVRGEESKGQPQNKENPQRQPGRLPLPD